MNEIDLARELIPNDQITAACMVGKKLYIFTPTRTYVAKPARWYHKLFNRLFKRSESPWNS